jgi:hypothetical protein
MGTPSSLYEAITEMRRIAEALDPDLATVSEIREIQYDTTEILAHLEPVITGFLAEAAQYGDDEFRTGATEATEALRKVVGFLQTYQSGMF